jgi:hypothetical protein
VSLKAGDRAVVISQPSARSIRVGQIVTIERIFETEQGVFADLVGMKPDVYLHRLRPLTPLEEALE